MWWSTGQRNDCVRVSSHAGPGRASRPLRKGQIRLKSFHYTVIITVETFSDQNHQIDNEVYFLQLSMLGT